MAKRQKDWARRKRDELLAELGGLCAYCGDDFNLEFDCKDPVSNGHGKYDTSHRMSFYCQQHRLGNIQLLCPTCNRVKGNRRHSSISPF